MHTGGNESEKDLRDNNYKSLRCGADLFQNTLRESAIKLINVLFVISSCEQWMDRKKSMTVM